MGISRNDVIPDLMIERGQYGKPFFPSLPNVRFNFSHSGSWIACAFSDCEVGLDLQAHDQLRVDGLRIARRFFTHPEYQALVALSSDQTAMKNLFFRFWTIKEAYLKYVGCGLYAEPDSFLPLPAGRSAGPDYSPATALRGSIEILKRKDLLTPGVYAVLPAPDGYSMAVSAGRLPEEISVRRVEAPHL
ncbi:MAG: 4'-phosphopantetheinyl transferase superfamily protein [Lachnospiraceae bacterium]|nr:4'-phosphopantetheinyl transferase superfamily protein [Lachnospiraceae bacterium]